MSVKMKCTHCGKDVVPESFSGRNFCPECGNEIVAQAVPEQPVQEKPDAGAAPSENGAAVIKDGMGIIENARNKVGAVESFSDNSVTNHTTNNTTNITNVTDDTKKSVVCEISGKKVLVTSSVQCPVCGKTVSNQYYDEDKLRCVECEKKAVSEYEKYYTEFTAGVRVIDKELRDLLDRKASVLKLTGLQVKEVEMKLRKAHSGKEAHLSDIKQKDFERTIAQMCDEKATPDVVFDKIAAYAKITDDDAVQCWYHAIWASYKSKMYIDALKNATVDDYWQRYWAFLAYAEEGDIAGAVDAVDVAKEKYPEKINDIIIAQAYLGVFQYLDSGDDAYVMDSSDYIRSVSGPDSPCLQFHYDRYVELDELFAPDDFNILKIWQLVLTRKIRADRTFLNTPYQPSGPAPQKPVSAGTKPQAAAAPSKPAPAKPSPSKPAAARPTPVTPAPVKPAPQNPAPSQKGVVINNTAGGPQNPQVSFAEANAPAKKKSPVLAVIAVVAVLGIVGWFLLGGKGETVEEVAPETVVENPVATPEQASVPVSEESVTSPASDKAATLAEKKAAEKKAAEEKAAVEKAQTMAEKAAADAAASSSTPAVGAEDYSKAMSAYESGDYKTAHDLFRKAGTAGNADACYQLGLMLSTGKGTVAKNPLQAKVWLKKAAGLGHADAQAALNSL